MRLNEIIKCIGTSKTAFNNYKIDADFVLLGPNMEPSVEQKGFIQDEKSFGSCTAVSHLSTIQLQIVRSLF